MTLRQIHDHTLPITGWALSLVSPSDGQNRARFFHHALNVVPSGHPIWIGFLEKDTSPPFSQWTSLVFLTNRFILDTERIRYTSIQLTWSILTRSPLTLGHIYPNKMTYTRTTNVTSCILNCYIIQHNGKTRRELLWCRQTQRVLSRAEDCKRL
jgi:hypothetical protein